MLVIDAIFLQTNKKHVRPTKQINIFESSLIRYKVILQKKMLKKVMLSAYFVNGPSPLSINWNLTSITYIYPVYFRYIEIWIFFVNMISISKLCFDKSNIKIVTTFLIYKYKFLFYFRLVYNMIKRTVKI